MNATKIIAIGTVVGLAWSVGTVAAKDPNNEYGPITVSAGSVGGSWFVVATSLLDLYENNIEGLRYNITPGGGVGNPMTVQNGDAQMAIAYTTNLHAAKTGEAPYPAPLEDLRAILNLNITSVTHPFVLKSTGLENLEDVAKQEYGLEIDTGTRGTGGELASSRILEAHGATYEDIRAWGGSITHSSYRESLDRMKDGHIEAFMNDDVVGHPLFVDLSVSRDVKLLPMNEEAVSSLQETYGYVPSKIPKGTYEGQTKDILTVGQQQALFVHKDMPDDLVYNMVKLAFENKERLVRAYKGFEDLNLEQASKNMSIPLHPGAKRFYEEKEAL